MSTIDIIKQRYSCRDFKDDPVTEDVIRTLCDCALAAPTGVNRQGVRFHVITDRKLIDEISEKTLNVAGEAVRERIKNRGATSIFYGAPLVIVLSSEEDPYDEVNAGIAVQTLALAAQAEGLASCIIAMASSAFRDDELPGKLGFRDGERFIVSIAIGHPNTGKDPHEGDKNNIVRHI